MKRPKTKRAEYDSMAIVIKIALMKGEIKRLEKKQKWIDFFGDTPQ